MSNEETKFTTLDTLFLIGGCISLWGDDNLSEEEVRIFNSKLSEIDFKISRYRAYASFFGIFLQLYGGDKRVFIDAAEFLLNPLGSFGSQFPVILFLPGRYGNTSPEGAEQII